MTGLTLAQLRVAILEKEVLLLTGRVPIERQGEVRLADELNLGQLHDLYQTVARLEAEAELLLRRRR